MNLRRSGFPGLLFCPDFAYTPEKQDISAHSREMSGKKQFSITTVRVIIIALSSKGIALFEGVSRL